MQFTIYQESRRGGRKVNQDRIAHSYSRDSLMLLVADGMGGHASGDVAAQIAVQIMIERFQKQANPIIEDPAAFLRDIALRAHSAITEYARERNMLENPRTTYVSCIVQDDCAYWSHVGDSRLYLFRGVRLMAQTRDHSKVQQMVDHGLITELEATNHPERNKIYTCLGGTMMPQIEASRRTPLHPGDTLLLCTDGLWGMFSPDEIASILASLPLAQAIPELLSHAELRAGKDGDNLSVIGVTWGGEPQTDVPAISTVTMPHGDFQTTVDEIDVPKSELTDDEIEQAILEIQHAIKKFSK